MRSIAHISDLHFGHLDYATLPALKEAIEAARPHLVVVSGDLTQRARAAQFAEARKFLDTLPRPQLVVPGNHDVPLYNVFLRAFNPLGNYRRHISENFEPFHADAEMAVLGLNTARSLTFKDGRINEQQVQKACELLGGAPHGASRIIVTHHPFDAKDTEDEDDIVGRARMAMKGFAACKVDMILTGHMHESHSSDSGSRYQIPGYAALHIAAGTATSTRRRGESNAWNFIRIDQPDVWIDKMNWDNGKFVISGTEHFQKTESSWEKIR